MTPEKARDLIVRAWRKPRDTPRPDDPTCFEDNAPDWVWKLADAVTACTTLEVDGGFGLLGELVAWCAEGEAETRSTRVQTLITAWVGPRVPMLRAFLDVARKTGAGRQAIDPATGVRPYMRPQGKGEYPEWRRKNAASMEANLDALAQAGLVASIDRVDDAAERVLARGQATEDSAVGELEQFMFFGADWKPFVEGSRLTYYRTDDPVDATRLILACRSRTNGTSILVLPKAFVDSTTLAEVHVGGQMCSIVAPRQSGVALSFDMLLFDVSAMKTAADLSWFRVVARGVRQGGSIIAILPNKT